MRKGTRGQFIPQTSRGMEQKKLRRVEFWGYPARHNISEQPATALRVYCEARVDKERRR